MSYTTAHALTQQLQSYGVNHIFGIPGVHTLELYRALASTTIRHITPRHEQGAGFMADGYARVSGNPGVCFIISGPGMTNILTAMGQAYSESVPLLVISAVNAHGRMGSGNGHLHELPNQQATVSGVCAFSHTIHEASEVTQVLARAFAIFDSQRPRPVHIEIPINVLKAAHAEPAQRPFVPLRLKRPVAPASEIEKASQWLADAQRPVILAGGGARNAAGSLAALAEHLDAPVVMTVNARGLLPHTHPLAVSASASLEAVRTLIREADVVLGIGTEMGPTDYDFNENGEFGISGTFIRIDIDAQQLVRSYAPEVGLIGDAQSTCLAIYEKLRLYPKQNYSGKERTGLTTRQTLASLSHRESAYLATLSAIRDTLPGAVIAGDSTQLIYAGNSAFGMDTATSWFNSAMGFGTLGYALSAALGAAVANAERPVVAISGDGGLQFCLAELTTAVDEKLPIILIVHENGGYHEINRCMQEEQIAPVGVDLLAPDLGAIAEACGWQSTRVATLDELPDCLKRSSSVNTPVMLLVDDRLFE